MIGTPREPTTALSPREYQVRGLNLLIPTHVMGV